jgi:integrase
MNYKKNAKGYYEARIPKGRNDKGQILYQKIASKTRKGLEQKLKEAHVNEYKGVKNTNQTFGHFADMWISSRVDISTNTRKQYDLILKKYLSPLNRKKISEIVPYDLQSIINSAYSEGKSKSTLKVIKLIGTNIMQMAIYNKAIGYNAFLSVKVPKTAKQTERQPLTDAQREAVVKLWQGHRMGIGALIMLNCGLRKGELLALKWSDIDFKNQVIKVNKTIIFDNNNSSFIKDSPKTKYGIREVPFSEGMLSALKEYRKAQKGLGSVFVIPDINGQLMTYTAFKRAWESYLHYLNIASGGKDRSRSNPKITIIEKFTPHQLRHTYGSTIYNQSNNIKVTQYLLGHNDIKTTMNIYVHTDEKEVLTSIKGILENQDRELKNLCNF